MVKTVIVKAIRGLRKDRQTTVQRAACLITTYCRMPDWPNWPVD